MGQAVDGSCQVVCIGLQPGRSNGGIVDVPAKVAAAQYDFELLSSKVNVCCFFAGTWDYHDGLCGLCEAPVLGSQIEKVLPVRGDVGPGITGSLIICVAELVFGW